jgi:Phosphodiester glycosidase
MSRSARILAALGALAAFGAIGGGLLRTLRGPVGPEPRADAPSAAIDITPESIPLAGDGALQLLVFPVHIAGAHFRVIDLGMGRDIERTLDESGASLVVNGGFFDPADRPEGLVISAGEILSAQSASLGGGIVAVTNGRAVLAPADAFLAPAGTEFAIQARPRLVVDGGSNIARDDGRAAERTAMCLRAQGGDLEVIVARGEAAGQGPTLAGLADALVRRGCEGALNLDGGPSTGVAWRQDGAVHVLAPRGPLRHAIAIWAPAVGG